MGLRTLSKIVKIVDEEMASVGGQKLNMPKLLPKELWEKTGRWNDMGNELIRLKDRKGEDFCLAPTHEEIVTSLAAAGVSSPKQLPLRLYQIGDKYRDEARPRFGLLRAREFVMKDMYSFDVSKSDAIKTYEEVREAYIRVMQRLELPFAIAEADSGNIGGNMSHEFHALASVGEDTLLCCQSNNYFANVEKAKSVTKASIDPSRIPQELLAPSPSSTSTSPGSSASLQLLLGHLLSDKPSLKATIFTDASKPYIQTLALTDSQYDANPYLVKSVAGLGVEYSVKVAGEPGAAASFKAFLEAPKKQLVLDLALMHEGVTGDPKLFVERIQQIARENGFSLVEQAHIKVSKVGDECLCTSSCTTKTVLVERKGIEVGHLFYLGTKYSAPLKATVPTNTGGVAPIEMGCYGIGVSRLLAVAVETANDEKGIIWPKSIAPFQVSVIPTKHYVDKAQEVISLLSASGVSPLIGEIVLDDRVNDSVGYRIKESEFIGIPYVISLGSHFGSTGLVEVIARKSGKKSSVPLDQLTAFFRQEYNEAL